MSGECLEGVKLKEYRMVIYELRNFARMVRAARDYLAERMRPDATAKHLQRKRD